MSGLFEMLKMNLKLLLRNKSYLCFLVVLPVMAILVLNIPNTSGYESNGNTSYEIEDIKNIDKQIIKMDNTQLSIKVYDASSSYLSDYILNELAKSGSYKIYRYKDEDLSKEEAEKNSVKTFNRNNIGAVINDILSTNYAAFFIWCLSNLVSGTYFSIENASKLWKRISLLTPQRWLMKCSQMLIYGRNGAVSTMILVTFAFLIVILSIGTIGLKVARNE